MVDDIFKRIRSVSSLTMNNSNKKLTLFTIPGSKLSPEHLPNSDVSKFQLCQFIGQYLAALELCFDNQKDFNDYTVEQNISIGNTPCVIDASCIIDL